MAGRRRSFEKELYWREILDRHRESGLGVRRFCRESTISEQAFFRWRRLLAKRVALADPDLPGHRLVPVSIVPNSAPELSPVALAGPGQVEVTTPAGFLIRFDASLDSRRLANVLRAVEDVASGDVRC
jgi:transposase-like protein